MTITDLIAQLHVYRDKHGNVTLYSQKSDGYSSWNSPIRVEIIYKSSWPDKHNPHHYISVTNGY